MGRTYRVCVIPGDGIGTQVTAQAVRILETASASFAFGLSLDEQP